MFFHALEVRPGVVMLCCIKNNRRKMIATFCQDCGGQEAEEHDYLVRDVLWRFYAPEDGILCLDCLETRLGRGLDEDVDFRPGYAPGQARRRDKICRLATCICMQPGKPLMCHCRKLLYTQMLMLDEADLHPTRGSVSVGRRNEAREHNAVAGALFRIRFSEQLGRQL